MENFLLECSFCNLQYLHAHVQVLLLTLFSAPQLLHRHEGCDCSKTVLGDGIDTQRLQNESLHFYMPLYKDRQITNRDQLEVECIGPFLRL
jgi:hypothetical protein